MVMPDVAAAIDIRLGRVEEARSLIADWLKIGPFFQLRPNYVGRSRSR